MSDTAPARRALLSAILIGAAMTVSTRAAPIKSVDAAAATTQPDFGPNVLVFDPSMKDVQARVSDVFARQEHAQFGSERYALLFKPGQYNLDLRVGFYTHVIGLGHSPDDVNLTGALRATAEWMHGNATCNFWRAAENLSVTPVQPQTPNVWAVSQGVALRRMHFRGDLNLWDNGWSSGGFLADSKIDGRVTSGSQQQWLSRNDEWGEWHGGNWNMVFVGVNRPPEGEWPHRPYTTIQKTPLVREKPYLTIDDAGRYAVIVPPLRTDAQGVSWSQQGESVAIDKFFIAKPGDSAATINDAVAGGKHLLLTPGIYHLAEPIRITRPDTIVLGIGYPTLVPDNGTAAMTIADVDGVKVAGVLLEAGQTESPNLLEVGEPGTTRSHKQNPICLSDLFCRAGGAIVGQTRCFVTLHSSDVVGDNFWLWRADHGAGHRWDENRNANGLIVNGNDVTIYGLFVEHCQEYQTVWNGNGGRVYFYQSEMPYDPPSEQAWMHNGVVGYASYKVADHVKTHEAWGVGVYCVFWDASIIAQTAIEVPETPGVQMHHLIAIRLNGKPNSGIRHVINDRGESVINKQKSIVD